MTIARGGYLSKSALTERINIPFVIVDLVAEFSPAQGILGWF
jgi:hypothetical protein